MTKIYRIYILYRFIYNPYIGSVNNLEPIVVFYRFLIFCLVDFLQFKYAILIFCLVDFLQFIYAILVFSFADFMLKNTLCILRSRCQDFNMLSRGFSQATVDLQISPNQINLWIFLMMQSMYGLTLVTRRSIQGDKIVLFQYQRS